MIVGEPPAFDDVLENVGAPERALNATDMRS
jgi:hypothetical protein